MYRRICFYGGPGTGKCFGKGTPVLMYDGNTKPVEEIEIGEFLMGPDSCPRKVVKTHSGTDNLYRIHPVKGDSYVVNSRHTLSMKKKTFHRTGRCIGEDTINLDLKDYLSKSNKFRHHAKGWRSSVDFSEKDVPIDSYIFGLWLGDGISASARWSVADVEILEALEKYAESIGMPFKQHSYKQNSKAQTYSISRDRKEAYLGNPITCALKEVKVFNNKHIPLIYKANSKIKRLELLAGLIDSDGWVEKGKAGAGYCSIISKLSNDVAYLCRSLGFAAYVTPLEKSCLYKGERKFCIAYQVTISGDLSIIPTRISRKKFVPRKQVKNVLRTGIEVEDIGTGKYYGFEVKGNDHLFLLGDFTVVHNSTTASDLFAVFKRMTVDSKVDRQFELIQEFVKTWAWEGKSPKGFDQVFIFANQQQREEIPLRAGVHHIFTDSPLFLGAAYARKYKSKTFNALISLAELHEEEYPGLHIFLDRGDRPYVGKGRFEDEDKARSMDDYIRSMLDLYVGSDNYITIPYGDRDTIIETIADRLGLFQYLPKEVIEGSDF